MTTKLFLILIISTQAIFIALDFVNAYFEKKKDVKTEKKSLKPLSLFFLIGVIIVYALIQFGGLALIPKTEVLIQWFKEFIPSIQIFNFENTPPPLGWLLLGVFTFYISGFWDYVIHRFLSHSRTLFFTHEYHHLPNRLFLALPGLSVRPFVVIAVLPATLGTVFSIIAVLKILNLENVSLMPMVYVIILIQSVILAITHSEFFMSQWWMYRWFKFLAITSPQEHEMHHTVDLRGNYGNFTMLYDKLFGTYVDPAKPENQNHALGLSYDQDFLGALTAGKLKLSKKIRQKYQIDRFCNLDKESNR
jgi:sterol desaturase/sphingolipid hydroxylase (fatty acid hydroxylase superfamily)